MLEMGIKSDVTGVCYIPIYLINKQQYFCSSHCLRVRTLDKCLCGVKKLFGKPTFRAGKAQAAD